MFTKIGSEKAKYYFYRTENTLNGKFYYGVRHSKDPEHDPYLGSGLVLKEAIRKHGRCVFQKTILEYFDTMEEAYSREAEVVNETLISNPKCYNIKYGGRGGFNNTTIIHKGSQLRRVCKVSVPKYLELGWKEGYSKEHSENVGKAKAGHKHSEETKRKIGLKSAQRTHTEATKLKMSQSHKGNLSTSGRIWVNNSEEEHSILPVELQEWAIRGYVQGRKKSSTRGFEEHNTSIKALDGKAYG